MGATGKALALPVYALQIEALHRHPLKGLSRKKHFPMKKNGFFS
jgi:hypothetical protein